MSTIESLSSRVSDLTSKMNVLVKGNRPANINEFISVQTIIIITIVAILGAIWGTIIMKWFELEDEKNVGRVVLITIISIVIIMFLAWMINKD